MRIWEIILISISLSMDAFAVAMCRGLQMKKFSPKQAAVIALFFGGFQAGMPLVGWFIGVQFEKYITAVDHWITFALLLLIGGKMLYDAIRGGDEESGCDGGLGIRRLLLMSVATSIDALAVGVTFAFLQTDIYVSVAIIGCVTFLLSFAGVALGNRFGVRYRDKAGVFGGAVLILIGIKILLEHLGVIAF